ncbi:MAG: hypothetical protein WCR01_11055 [Bacteroidota bacterium]
MTALPDIIRKNGFTYTQVCRDEKKAIYRQDVPPDLTYFEVFKIKIGKERTFKGKTLPHREMFPGNEAFGDTAWSCKTLETAMERYNQL